MGRLADWWSRRSGAPARPAAYRPPPEARFTEIGTNYTTARSTEPTWSAPNPYTGYTDVPSGSSTRAQAAGQRRPSGPPAWGTAPGAAGSTAASTTTAATPAAPAPTSAMPTGSATGPSSPYLQPGGPAAPSRRTGRRARAATGATFALVATVVVVVAVVAIGLIVGATSNSDSNQNGRSSAPELEAAWTISSYDLSDDYGTFDSTEGTVSGAVLETSYGWVGMVEPSTLEAQLFSADPESGDVQWQVPMPEGRCTAPDLDTLRCLTREGGSTFELVTIAVETGERVGDPIATELRHVPVLLVPIGDTAFVTLSVASELAAFDVEGTTLWTEPIDLGDYDVNWLEVDSVAYESSVILYLGQYIGTVHATPAGATVYACQGVAATPQGWMCRGEDEAVGYAPEGTELWREDWRDYYLVDRYQHIAPVMIVDNWDGSISAIDPLTGDHGPAISLNDGSGSFNLLGDAEHPVVFTEDTVNLLDPDLTTVLWSTPIRDEYLNIAGGGVVGDTLIVDGAHSYGFDLATGELAWERDFLSYNSYLVGDGFVGLRISDMVRYELP